MRSRFRLIDRTRQELVEPCCCEPQLGLDCLLLPGGVSGVAGFEVEEGGSGQHPVSLTRGSDIPRSVALFADIATEGRVRLHCQRMLGRSSPPTTRNSPRPASEDASRGLNDSCPISCHRWSLRFASSG